MLKRTSALRPFIDVGSFACPTRKIHAVAAILPLVFLLISALGALVGENTVSSHLRRASANTVSVAPPACGPPLHTEGSQIKNAESQTVVFTGVNWFGFETTSFAPQGLNVRNYQDMLNQMAHLGFNTLRLPYSNQLFDPASTPTGINYALNPDLRGLQGLALMDKIVKGAQKAGLCVILDRHRPDAYAQSSLWHTPQVPQSRWIHDWVMLANHYKNNPAVVGADLDNEPHDPATWGDSNPATDWRLAAEKAGNAVLAVDPHWLIMVEGIALYEGDPYWWGGNLEGAGQYPVELSVPHQLVYSAHDYGPQVYDMNWFQVPSFPKNMPRIWQKHWAYLQLDDIAPVIVGEFGDTSVGTDPDGTWQRAMAAYIVDNGFGYIYWSWSPNTQDTSGLLENDWTTIDRSKFAILPYVRLSAIVGPEPLLK
jgi:endoglucanase